MSDEVEAGEEYLASVKVDNFMHAIGQMSNYLEQSNKVVREESATKDTSYNAK
jgi:hypothetical protein